MSTNFQNSSVYDPVLSNQSSLQTDFSSAGSAFYSPGGKRDNQLKCQFICESPKMAEQGQPSVIELDLAPTGVSWDYNLRHQIYNTIGGQVIQILGVDITKVVISGRFGFESWFGKQYDPYKQTWNSLYNTESSIGNDKPYIWKNDPNVKNGLMQMAHWFRAYFNSITQSGDGGHGYDQYPMYFSFPHRGWWWPIRPRAFPNIKFSHGDFAPYWMVEADYLQYLQNGVDGSLESETKSSIEKDMANLTNGVGVYTDFLKFIDPSIVNASAEINTYATKFGNSYGSYTAGLAAAETYLNVGGLNGVTPSSGVLNTALLTDIGIKVP